jgi:hypothetical protein
VKRAQADLDRNAGVLKEDGLPDSFNRLLGATPEKLDAMKEASMAQKIGPREQALRAQRENAMRPARKPAAERPAPAPAARQPAPEAPAPDKPKETTVTKTQTTTKKAPAAKKSTRAAKKAAKVTAAPKTPKAAKTTENGDGPREGSKLAIIYGLLTRKEGCTTKEVLEACKWPAVSMPQQAKALGITLRKEKDGSASRYFAA